MRRIIVRRALPSVLAGLIGLSASAAVEAGLLMQYTFDNQTAADSVAPASNGTLIGPSTGFVTNTPNGSGYAFSAGVGDNYITTGTVVAPNTEGANDNKLDSLSSFTLVTWINFQAAPAAFDRIMSKQFDPVGQNGFSLDIVAPTSGSQSIANFGVSLNVDAVTSTAVNVTGLALNEWVFLAATYNGSVTSNNVTYYIGDLDSSVTQLGVIKSINSGVTNGHVAAFQVGGTTASSLDRSPQALFDDVRIYGAAPGNGGVLSLGDLESIRSSAVPVPEPAGLGVLALGAVAILQRRCRAK